MDNMSQNTDVRPEHYKKTSLECKDLIRMMFGDEAYMWFCMGNTLKYLWRHEHKNGEIDIKKAEWYLKESEVICMKLGFTAPTEMEGLNTILQQEKRKYEDAAESELERIAKTEPIYDIYNSTPYSERMPSDRKWTPCSERMPDCPPLIQGEKGYIVQEEHITEPFTAYWDGQEWTDYEEEHLDDIIAWMPLPEPYKESR